MTSTSARTLLADGAVSAYHPVMPEERQRATTYAVWPTAWGPMGAAGGEGGVCRVVLPHYQRDELADLLAWEYPNAKMDESGFGELVALSREYFNGKPADFTAVKCDLPSERTFAGKVLCACRKIPYGQTRSYLAVAEMIASPDSSRAVAAALGRNAIPLVVPCHRVIYADGRPGGFSAAGGTELKERMLRLERTAGSGR